MKNGTRTLLVDYMLRRLTGEDCYLSRDDFILKIKQLGGKVSSDNTIKADLEAIKEFNNILENRLQDIVGDSCEVDASIDFESVKKKGNHITKEVFNPGELIILSKFIESCFYLNTEEKTKLMQKVLLNSSLCTISKYNLDKGFDETTHYNPNETSLITINTIQKAITNDKCLKFKYYTYKISNNDFIRVDSQNRYYIYPIRFVMDGNYLYVIGYDLGEYNQKIMKNTTEQLRLKNYRVDRIFQLQCIHRPKIIDDLLSKDIIQEAKTMVDNNINGFGGDEFIKLKLKIMTPQGIEKSPFKTFVDRFGHNIVDVLEKEEYLIVTIDKVLNGVGLVHYLFGFDQQIEVIEPEELRTKMIDIIKIMKNNYENS